MQNIIKRQHTHYSEKHMNLIILFLTLNKTIRIIMKITANDIFV